jgi:hypothetical protein
MHANFEFLDKLGVDFWCFHDRDIAPEGATLAETNANLDAVRRLCVLLRGSVLCVLRGGRAMRFALLLQHTFTPTLLTPTKPNKQNDKTKTIT